MAKTKKRANEYSSSSHIDLNHPEKYLPKSEWNKPLQQTIKQQQKQQPVQITADTSITSAFPQNEVINKIKQYKDNPSKEDFQTRNADRLQRLENLNSQLGEAVNTLQQSTDLNIKPNTASKEKINPFSSEQTVYDNWQRALTQYEYNKENAFDNMQKSYLDKNSFANYQLNANPEDLQLTEKKIQQLKERHDPKIVDEFLQTHKIVKDEYINGVGQTYKFVPVNPVSDSEMKRIGLSAESIGL